MSANRRYRKRTRLRRSALADIAAAVCPGLEGAAARHRSAVSTLLLLLKSERAALDENGTVGRRAAANMAGRRVGHSRARALSSDRIAEPPASDERALDSDGDEAEFQFFFCKGFGCTWTGSDAHFKCRVHVGPGCFMRNERRIYMRREKVFTPNQRDIEVLRTVYDYRYLSIDVLAALLCEPAAEGRQYGFTIHALRARCQKLREHGYLAWQHLRDEPVGRGYKAERPVVYSIGPTAIDVLAERTGLTPRHIKSEVVRNTVTSFFLRHELGISRFRASLELMCRASQGKVRIGTWLQGGLMDRVRAVVDDEERDIAVVPDAAFNLVVCSADGGQRVSHYFLEYDTGSMSLRRIALKAVGYEQYLNAGLHRRRYTYAGAQLDALELRFVRKAWQDLSASQRQTVDSNSAKTFQVLFVCKNSLTDARLENGNAPTVHTRQRNVAIAIRGAVNTQNRFLIYSESSKLDFNQSSEIPIPVLPLSTWRE